MSAVDDKAFAKLKRIAPTLLQARREPHDWHARPLPEEIGLKLTNRCDLRCTHCYQWNDDGYHHSLPMIENKRDLSLAIVDKVLAATHELRSNVFLWGGEPLTYRHWDELVDRLVAHERWTSVCTNGTLIERRLPSLERFGQRLEMSVSIDGFASEHDALRGDGAFARTLAGVRALVRGRRAGTYAGEITINCVIGDALVPRLHDFVRFVEDEGVETVFLSFPWHISSEAAAQMDAYVAAHLADVAVASDPSWRSFTFRLDPASIEPLRAQLARIAATDWKLKLRYNPELRDGDELREFLAGSARPAQGKTRCNAVRTRIDVFPNGDVVSCKLFPDMTVGNLEHDSLDAVWHGSRFDRVRETVATCGLMPICAKCNLLYTRGT